MIRSTMSESPLTINAVLRHGRRVHADSECVTFTGDGVRRASYGQVADNADRLAGALQRLGVGPGDPVGTFMWNDQEHLEAYFAVPCMGSVLHTLNIRLSPEQLVFVANHAKDRVVLVDSTLVPVLAPVASRAVDRRGVDRRRRRRRLRARRHRPARPPLPRAPRRRGGGLRLPRAR